MLEQVAVQIELRDFLEGAVSDVAAERPLLSGRRIRHAPEEPRFIVGLFPLKRIVAHKIRLACKAGDQPPILVPTPDALSIVRELAAIVSHIRPPYPVIVSDLGFPVNDGSGIESGQFVRGAAIAKAADRPVHGVAGEVGLPSGKGGVIGFVERAKIGFSHLQVRPIEPGFDGGSLVRVEQAWRMAVRRHVKPARAVIVGPVRPG